MPETHGIPPSDKIQELVSHFLREAAMVGETDPSDVFGVKPLMFLIKALRIIGAPEAEWDRIAYYSLNRTKGLALYYKPILSELVQHVSADMVERIRVHFVSNGELGALMNLLRLRAWRRPSSEEVLEIARYLRKDRRQASSTIWQELFAFATCADSVTIEALRQEVQKEEEL